MIVEWIGGSKDGECFEAPDDCRFIMLMRAPVLHARWPNGTTDLDDFIPDEETFPKRRFDIVTQRNGKHYVYWSEKWA